ncbi:MAG: OmpA family protein [Methylococcaceae bacterium]|nr:OmpA family protein [Methylococcaceae bacterium]
MKKYRLIATTCLGAILTGCSIQPIRTFESPTIVNLDQLVQSGEYTQKTQVLYTVLDASSSMSEAYQGINYPGDSTATKFAVEKVLLQRLNKSMVDLPLNAVAIRNFGKAPCLSLSGSDLVYGAEKYSKQALHKSLGKTECVSGGSPINKALEAASGDLKKTTGNIALLILSDGYHFNASPESTIKALKKQYADRLCVYSIWVGNTKEQEGQAALAALTTIAGCGLATKAEDIASERTFDAFAKEVFLTQAQPVVAAIEPPAPVDGDEDQDGVPDSRDKCPKTPKGAKVNKDGCWVIEGVNFDFDKSVIKPQYYPLLDDVVTVIDQNPGLNLNIEIQGHTDNIGTPAYNLPLSKRRAYAVKQYLSNKVGKKAAFTSEGFGLTQPIDTNATAEGRAHNRRSQLLVID